MKRRWRRLILVAGTVLLTACLIVIGLAVWLYKSGRLATLSQNLLQRFSGQEVTIGSIEFPNWYTVAFSDVRLQQRVAGWQVTVEGPRLEAYYSLTGLWHKQVDGLFWQQPLVELSYIGVPSPPLQQASPLDAQSVGVLPLKRLRVRQGALHVRWNSQMYTLQPLDATLRAQGDRQLQVDISGRLQDTASTLQAVAHVTLAKPLPAGRLQLTANSVPVAQVPRMFFRVLPSTWNATKGMLDIDADLNFQERTVQGSVSVAVGQVTAQAQGLDIRQATFAIETAIKADLAEPTLRLEGQARLQAERASGVSDMVMANLSLSTEVTVEFDSAQQMLHAEGQLHLQADQASKAPDMTLTTISLMTPWRLSYTPARWHLSATPTVQSGAAQIGTLVRASRLSLQTKAPVHLRHNRHGLQVQGLPELTVETLKIHADGQTEPPLFITGLRGRLALQGNPTRLDITDARVQMQARPRQTTDETEMVKDLSLQGSGAVELGRQRLAVHDVTISLPQLGRIAGSGTWHWPSHTLHDLQVQLAPTTVDTLQSTVRQLLPTIYTDWQIAGQTELRLRATQVSLRSPQRVQNLVIAWQIRDGAFSSPDGVVAGEHLNGTLQAIASFDQAARQVTLQGTLTLHPFALLIGSVFPAIEENRITSVMTFSGVYNSGTEGLQVDVAGQFGNLGMLTLQGTVQQPITNPQYDMQLQLRDLHAARVWKTFMSDAVRFPSLTRAEIQGTLNATLRLRGQPTRFTLQGNLEVINGHVRSDPVALRSVSLVLPLQIPYPLPQTAPQITSLPPDAYGHLSIAAVRIGSVELAHLRIGLALRSDTLLFQQDVHIPLWGGQITLANITARHILRPQRRVALHARLRNLNLQQIPRGASKLPLAGIINGDFPLFQIHGDQLETEGSLTIDVAGGMIRFFDVQGGQLFSMLSTLRCSFRTEQPLSLLYLSELYPIGGIGGTVRFSVTDLVITAGEPAAFSLEFAVQEKGGEKREITLRALNNLLFTTGSAKVASGLLGDTYRLPYKRFGASITLRNDTLHLRGKYHDRQGKEYFMQAPALGGGVSIVNQVPENGIPFRNFLQRLTAIVLDRPDVKIQ